MTLLVWPVFVYLKAYSLSRVTVVREGMSVGEGRVIGSTLQSDGTGIQEWFTVFNSSEWCEFRQVYLLTHFINLTSHDQLSWFIVGEFKCISTKLNGSQFRQIYSSFSSWWVYSQTPHENTYGMLSHQTGVISNWAILFIIPINHNPTLQFQWSISETTTPSIQLSNFNHFQRRHILNLTHCIITKGATTNLQFSQSLTIP